MGGPSGCGSKPRVFPSPHGYPLVHLIGINWLTMGLIGDTMGIYNGIDPQSIMGIINHHGNILSGNLT